MLKNKKQSLALWLLLPFAGLFFLLGIYIFFFAKPSSQGYYDSNLIAACFSLSGVFIFAATLFYQIKEYKLQIEELKRSVDAQTKTSIALEEQNKLMMEQKAIMIEQTRNDLVFNVIERFNTYKEREDIQKSIRTYYDALRISFTTKEVMGKIPRQAGGKFNMDEFSKILYLDILECFDEKKTYMVFLKNYIQYAFNIFELIEKHRTDMNFYYWFRPFFFNQFTNFEILLLYLSNLAHFEMPYSSTIKWRRPEVTNLLNTLQIKRCYMLDNSDEDYIFKYFTSKEYKDPDPSKINESVLQ